MRAFVIDQLTGPTGGSVRDVPVPQGAHPWAGADRLLVEVSWAGVSFPDLLQSRGLYQHGAAVPYVAGGEVAGRVLEAPANSRFSPGDRVAGLCLWGGMAEQALVLPWFTIALPDALSDAEGAALVLNHSTAWFALYRVQARPGETVVVHGAAGGVGTATVQTAVAQGLRVIAVVSDERKAELAVGAGAAHTLRPEPGWPDRVRELTDGLGADIVVDPVGGDRFTDSLRCLGVGGRVAVVGFTAGEIPTVKVNRLLLRDLSVVGVALAPYLERYPRTADEMTAAVEALVRDGGVRPIIGHELELADGGRALSLLEERSALGKVVVRIA